MQRHVPLTGALILDGGLAIGKYVWLGLTEIHECSPGDYKLVGRSLTFCADPKGLISLQCEA